MRFGIRQSASLSPINPTAVRGVADSPELRQGFFSRQNTMFDQSIFILSCDRDRVLDIIKVLG